MAEEPVAARPSVLLHRVPELAHGSCLALSRGVFSCWHVPLQREFQPAKCPRDDLEGTFVGDLAYGRRANLRGLGGNRYACILLNPKHAPLREHVPCRGHLGCEVAQVFWSQSSQIETKLRQICSYEPPGAWQTYQGPHAGGERKNSPPYGAQKRD